MKKIILKEETSKEVIVKWLEDANNQTLETLPSFLSHLMDDYTHDYGTICHALSIGSVATMNAMNKHEQGGITGFQAGAIMWENIQNWMTDYRDKPLSLKDYSKMLYPQYNDSFEKTISESTWEYLQKEAKDNLENNKDAHENVINHWTSIVNGIVPFRYVVIED